jgi:hypothetical protein
LGKDIQMMSKDKQERMFELVEQWKASGETMKDFADHRRNQVGKLSLVMPLKASNGR